MNNEYTHEEKMAALEALQLTGWTDRELAEQGIEWENVAQIIRDRPPRPTPEPEPYQALDNTAESAEAHEQRVFAQLGMTKDNIIGMTDEPDASDEPLAYNDSFIHTDGQEWVYATPFLKEIGHANPSRSLKQMMERGTLSESDVSDTSKPGSVQIAKILTLDAAMRIRGSGTSLVVAPSNRMTRKEMKVVDFVETALATPASKLCSMMAFRELNVMLFKGEIPTRYLKPLFALANQIAIIEHNKAMPKGYHAYTTNSQNSYMSRPLCFRIGCDSDPSLPSVGEPDLKRSLEAIAPQLRKGDILVRSSCDSLYAIPREVVSGEYFKWKEIPGIAGDLASAAHVVGDDAKQMVLEESRLSAFTRMESAFVNQGNGSWHKRARMYTPEQMIDQLCDPSIRFSDGASPRRVLKIEGARPDASDV